ncbi:MAG: FAD binding domain-containing protein, partial [Candidatus Omnitrophica bacterium]|nr:FAD binding domain-containing protein [Candidatus Omnitrophota bacterium]
MLLNPISVHSPKTIQEAARLYKSLPDVKLMAGGTFLLNSLKLLKRKGNKTANNVVSLRHIQGLYGISIQDGVLTIGAMTTISALYECSLLKDNLSILNVVCKNISTNPIRNMATVGGNLTCRYTWTEMGAVMIALDARMHFVSDQGVDHVMTAEEFFKAGARTDKIFSHVTIIHNPLLRVSYQRVKKTMHVDVPLLAVCICGQTKDKVFSNVWVSINNGVGFAQRDYLLEAFLKGKAATLETIEASMNHLNPEIYDKRSDDYK